MQPRKIPVTGPSPFSSSAQSCERPSLDAVTVRPPPSNPGEYRLDLAVPAAPASEKTSSAKSCVGFGLSWHFLARTNPVPLRVNLRALVECLYAVSEAHQDESRPSWARVVGCVCCANVLFQRDGSVSLVEAGKEPQPPAHLAPEARIGAGDARSDIYAVGVMLLEMLAGQTLAGEEIERLCRTDLAADAFWSCRSGDPLLMVALRATAIDPRRRFASATEMADAVEGTADSRLASKEELADFVQQAIRSQADRDTPVVSFAAGLQPKSEISSTSYVGAVSRQRAVPGEVTLLSEEDFVLLEDGEPSAAPSSESESAFEDTVYAAPRRRKRRRVPWGVLLVLLGGAA